MFSNILCYYLLGHQQYSKAGHEGLRSNRGGGGKDSSDPGSGCFLAAHLPGGLQQRVRGHEE